MGEKASKANSTQVARLAFLILLAGPAGGGEEIEIQAGRVEPGIFRRSLPLRATRDHPIEAFTLSVSFDPEKIRIIDFLPGGDWIFNHPPDFLADTLEGPGEPGTAGLVVILDTRDDGVRKLIPPAPGGGLEQIAELSIEILPGPGGSFPGCPLRIELTDGAARFGTGPPLNNTLVIGGQDYYSGSPEFPLVLRSGALWIFLRGDANFDCRRDITDALVILRYLFLGGEAPPCPDLADVNNDGALLGQDDQEYIDISDVIYLVTYLFLGAPEPDRSEGCPVPQ